MANVRCIKCGYGLDGHTAEYRSGVACPECGEKDAAVEPVVEELTWRRVKLMFAGLCNVIGGEILLQNPGGSGSAGSFVALAGCMLVVGAVLSVSVLKQAEPHQRFTAKLMLAIGVGIAVLFMLAIVVREIDFEAMIEAAARAVGAL